MDPLMAFQEYFVRALKERYALFDGRAARREYWFFVLFFYLVATPLLFLDIATGLFSHDVGVGVFSGLAALATLSPSLAVMIRRLHDTDRSGWWVLVAFVPIVGPIALIVFLVLPGTKGPNQYGPDPLAN
jgi:uncharacterized membrane protein YhaH (DUF805 family)